MVRLGCNIIVQPISQSAKKFLCRDTSYRSILLLNACPSFQAWFSGFAIVVQHVARTPPSLSRASHFRHGSQYRVSDGYRMRFPRPTTQPFTLTNCRLLMPICIPLFAMIRLRTFVLARFWWLIAPRSIHPSMIRGPLLNLVR